MLAGGWLWGVPFPNEQLSPCTHTQHTLSTHTRMYTHFTRTFTNNARGHTVAVAAGIAASCRATNGRTHTDCYVRTETNAKSQSRDSNGRTDTRHEYTHSGGRTRANNANNECADTLRIMHTGRGTGGLASERAYVRACVLCCVRPARWFHSE